MHEFDRQQLERMCGVGPGGELPDGVRDLYGLCEIGRCRISNTGPMSADLLLMIAVTGGGVQSGKAKVASRWQDMQFGTPVIIRASGGTHDYATGTLVGMGTGVQSTMVEVAVHGDQDTRRCYPEWRIRLADEEPAPRPAYESGMPKREEEIEREGARKSSAVAGEAVDEDSEELADSDADNGEADDELASGLGGPIPLSGLSEGDPVFVEDDDGIILEGQFVAVGIGDRSEEVRVKVAGQRGPGKYFPAEAVVPNRAMIREQRAAEQADAEAGAVADESDEAEDRVSARDLELAEV